MTCPERYSSLKNTHVPRLERETKNDVVSEFKFQNPRPSSLSSILYKINRWCEAKVESRR